MKETEHGKCPRGRQPGGAWQIAVGVILTLLAIVRFLLGWSRQ
ncbi:hypothetical protein [Streptomonospora alba]|nr:hypothetical protein [Streptomonospora alba]